MKKSPANTRRQFIKTSSALLAFSTVSAAAPLNADSIWRALQPVDAGRALVLYRDSDPQASAFAATLAAGGIQVQALAQDPVRQWRDGLGELVQQQNLIVLGMGNWTDYILVRGLAAEQRRHPLLALQHARAQDHEDWASIHAQELLQACACDEDSLRQALAALAQRGNLVTAAPSLFSWVLA